MSRAIILAAFAALALFAIWFLFFKEATPGGKSHFQKKTRTIDVGFRGYAAQNKLLASQRLLESMGEKARSKRTLFTRLNKLGRYDTLILASHSNTISKQQVGQLLFWVSRGGHLIVGAREKKEDEKKDVLFKRLAIKQKFVSRTGNSSITWFGQNTPLSIAFNTRARLKYNGSHPSRRISDQHGNLVYLIRHGNGSITVLSDVSVLFNKRIASYDHAALFNTITLPGRGNTYWLIYTGAHTPLLELLWTYLWAFFFGLITILALWFWKAFHRFGPLLKASGTSRRSLMEHIIGAGKLQWQYRGQSHFLKVARNALYKRIEKRHAVWLNLPEEELVDKLSHVSQIPRIDIINALHRTSVKGEQDFVRLIIIFNKLRNSL